MILVIDNYDSFTFNLVQTLEGLGAVVRVFRNDEIQLTEIEAMKPYAAVLSPGPCRPSEAGICVDMVRRFSGAFPILGVCLGHQAIAEAFGARIIHANRIMHGKTSMIDFGNSPLYAGIKSPSPCGRYHSLVVGKEGFPFHLVVDAISEDGDIMGIHHSLYPIFGVQFHPESILTPCGKRLIRNFLNIVGDSAREKNI